MEAMHKCPPIEVLEKFAAGRLPEPEAAAFEHHLAACGICSLVIERLGDFDHAARAVLNGVEPDWAKMERRLGVEPKPANSRHAGMGAWFRWPALGYALALLLAYPAWMGVGRMRVAPSPQGAAGAWASVADLNATRSLRGVPEIGANAGERAAVLQFFATAAPGVRQFAAILNARGAVVLDLGEIRSADGRGNFAIVVDPRRLPAGRYRLVVRAGEGESAETPFEFDRR